MELREMLKIFGKNIKIILAGIVIGAATSVLLFYFLPKKYYATGSLFVKRSIYPYSEEHFTYEGYYAQQAAMAYTNSIISIIESEDIRAQTIIKMNLIVNEKALRQYDRRIKAKKSGPQLIELITQGNSEQKAEELWEAVANTTGETVYKIGNSTDPFVGITKISQNPVLKESYRDLIVFTVTGTFTGTGFGIIIITIKSYLFGEKKKKKR